MSVEYSVLINSLALVGAFNKVRRRPYYGAFFGFCVVQGLGVQERLLVQCSLYRSTSARQHDRCRHVPTVAPQPPHNQDQPVSWPGKIFDHGEKYLVLTVRPGSSDLIITETVDCVHSLQGDPDM